MRFSSSHRFFCSRSMMFLWATSLLLFSCKEIKENNKETDPASDFLVIYENNDFSKSYLPVDVQQTADGGYLVLAKRRISESSFYGIYVMKADRTGRFIRGEEVSADLVNPVYALMKSGNGFYFFGMDRLTLEAQLIRLNEDGTSSVVAALSNVRYPLYASLEENTGEFLLQHYDPDELKTVVSKISSTGNITAQRAFSIGFGDFDVEEPVIDHLTGNGKQLPFLTGTTPDGGYFFNGFYNYTLSTVFFRFNSATPGLLQGYKDEKCLSAALALSNTNFAVSKYAYGSNVFAPKANINTASGAIASNSDIAGHTILELNPDAKVVLKAITGQSQPVLAYNSDTKNAQIVLYFYNASNGSFRGSKHFGYANPYEAGSFAQTADGGLVLVGTTYVAGRFPRIVLIKMSQEELNKDIH